MDAGFRWYPLDEESFVTPPAPLVAGPSLEGEAVGVVGGSVIGLACAWQAALTGADVTVFEPDDSGPAGTPAASAAWVAGGMLASFSEAWPGEAEQFALATSSAALWPGFLAGLEEAGRVGADGPIGGGADVSVGGAAPVRTAAATHLIAVDDADAGELERAVDWALTQPGADADGIARISRRELRAAEPSLARVVRAAYRVPAEGAVDNRRLLEALTAACRDAGVRWERRFVDSLDEVRADRVVLAAGSGAADLAGLPVRPVKGEVLRLRHRPGCEPAPATVVRGHVRGRLVYLVPREDGVVIGATQYEHGDDRAVTVAGVRDLLADAETLFPGIGEYELGECAAGLRPTSPDNLPIIGPLPGDDRVIAATGHGRNGIALAPVTAAAVLAYLRRTAPPAAVGAAEPGRPTTRARTDTHAGGATR